MGFERFYSYETLVCVRDLSTGVFYVGECFDISPTTRRQVCRFINERSGAHVCIADVRKAYDLSEACNPFVTIVCEGANARLAKGSFAPKPFYFGYRGNPYAFI